MGKHCLSKNEAWGKYCIDAKCGVFDDGVMLKMCFRASDTLLPASVFVVCCVSYKYLRNL